MTERTSGANATPLKSIGCLAHRRRSRASLGCTCMRFRQNNAVAPTLALLLAGRAPSCRPRSAHPRRVSVPDSPGVSSCRPDSPPLWHSSSRPRLCNGFSFRLNRTLRNLDWKSWTAFFFSMVLGAYGLLSSIFFFIWSLGACIGRTCERVDRWPPRRLNSFACIYVFGGCRWRCVRGEEGAI